MESIYLQTGFVLPKNLCRLQNSKVLKQKMQLSWITLKTLIFRLLRFNGLKITKTLLKDVSNLNAGLAKGQAGKKTKRFYTFFI